MADGYDDKTEPATPKRRAEAAESGQVARSQDLTAAVLLLTGLIAISMTARKILTSLADAMRALLANQYWGDQRELIDNSIRISVPHIFNIVWPIMLAVAIASILVTGMQVGWHFNPARLQ